VRAGGEGRREGDRWALSIPQVGNRERGIDSTRVEPHEVRMFLTPNLTVAAVALSLAGHGAARKRS
jgi:hypothetical protein